MQMSNGKISTSAAQQHWCHMCGKTSTGKLAKLPGTIKLHHLALVLFLSAFSFVLIAKQLSDINSSTTHLVQHVNAEFRHIVPSAYGIADGYYNIQLNYSRPSAKRQPIWGRYKLSTSNNSCWDLAKAHLEPYTAKYQPTLGPPTSLPGGIPRAAWKWEGRISRRLFTSVPFLLREAEIAADCMHCTFVLRYKVLDGRLYTDRKRRHQPLDGQEEEVAMIEELLLAALYMFKVPDVDFLLHLGDGSPAGLPLVQVNINRSNEQAGFTIPKYMWKDALGPEQFAVLTDCLQARYPPPPQREQRAVWRGSSTDSCHADTDATNIMHMMRTRLHMYGVWYPDMFDAHYTSIVQPVADINCLETMLPTGASLPLEDFNKYALILDIDGNGWSDRYRLLSHFKTPVLKQASNLTAFFEHLVAPGVVVEHYAHDLSDLPVRAAALLKELSTSPDRLLRMAEHQQGLAHYLLNQVSLTHATAYTLAQVAVLSNWKPAMEDNYELVPFSKCCTYAKQLPAAFIQAVQAHGTLQQ